MEWFTAHWQELGEAALALLGFFSIVARLTPTQVDDKILGKVTSFIHTFGLTKPGAP